MLKNDVDPEGDTFKVTGVTQGSKGIVEIGTNGANVLYTPDPNFIGTDTFTYTITDSTGATDTATVTVVVADVGEPPDAVNDAATVVEDSPPNVINVLANDKLVENPGGSTDHHQGHARPERHGRRFVRAGSTWSTSPMRTSRAATRSPIPSPTTRAAWTPPR